MSQMREPAAVHSEIADVQGSADARRIPIDRVGIKDIRHPLQVRDRAASAVPTVATFDMYVSLPHHQKGTHMSRFVAILAERQDVELAVSDLAPLAEMMIDRLEAERGYLTIRFPYYRRKAAPVSGVESLMDYEVTLRAESVEGGIETFIKVQVPVTSLCPCSKEISRYGAHNQRSHLTIEVGCAGDIWIEELIELAEAEASSELYGLLKRPDEKFVTERAYDNPKFVEDAVRDVAARLDAEPRVLGYVVESENFESIHNHSAYARIARDKTSGG